MEKPREVPLESGNTAVVANFNDDVSWRPLPQCNPNSTLLFIAVECVKDVNSSEINYLSRDSTSDFEHVSPLDPNMSSTARYSPSYVDAETSYNNSVMVQQLVANGIDEQRLISNNQEALVSDITNANTFEGLGNALTADANLFKRVLTNRYLLNQKYNPEIDGRIVQLVSNSVNSEDEVQLMITDEATGVSYNISTQEYLVERCLPDDEQLLDALEPVSLLNSEDLLTLDDSTLKCQLPEISDNLVTAKNLEPTNCNLPVTYDEIKIEEQGLKHVKQQKVITVPPIAQNSEEETQLHIEKLLKSRDLTFSSIPLPNLSAAVVKIDEGFGVVASKLISDKTRFGPLEGTFVPWVKEEESCLQLLIKSESGTLYRLDTSSQGAANWMSFVRKADTFEKQNLHLSQEGNMFYFTAITNIYPRQELLVGYGIEYALKYSLPFLKPTESNTYSCIHCKNNFSSLPDLQSHIQLSHELPTKKCLEEPINKLNSTDNFLQLTVECQFCKTTFCCSKVETLKKHLTTHGVISNSASWEEKFSILSYVCDKCEKTFKTKFLLKKHLLHHEVKASIQQKPVVSNGSSGAKAGFKCPICYKVFATADRIQRHTMVHGAEETKPHKCERCNKRFFNNSALACHLKTHNKDKKMFECPICKESFDHVLHLKVHVSKHRQDGKYTCPHCNKIFQEYCVIRKHIRAFHCDRKFNCPHCNKPFPTLDKLRMHSLRHSDHREFLCSDCGKQFKRKDKLKEHAKRMHADERENSAPTLVKINGRNKKFMPRVQPTDYHRFIYKCHTCFVGFKRRGMLVNHLAKRHPDVSLDSVPELNLPILRTTRDYYCQYCDKVYKSSSKRKAHILKNHPGQALPLSNRKRSTLPEVDNLPNATFSQTVGSVTTIPQACQWCHKQYASKAKLLQHQRKKHTNCFQMQSKRSNNNNMAEEDNNQSFESPNRVPIEHVDVDSPITKEDFQMTDEYLAEVVALNSSVKEEEQYYRILSLSRNNSVGNLNQVTEASRTSDDSRLYHLLTARNGLLPPSR